MDVWVYRYRSWNSDREENDTSKEYFTIEAIRSGLGIPLMETAMKVRFADLDDSGRFRAYTHPVSDTEHEG